MPDNHSTHATEIVNFVLAKEDPQNLNLTNLEVLAYRLPLVSLHSVSILQALFCAFRRNLNFAENPRTRFLFPSMLDFLANLCKFYNEKFDFRLKFV